MKGLIKGIERAFRESPLTVLEVVIVVCFLAIVYALLAAVMRGMAP